MKKTETTPTQHEKEVLSSEPKNDNTNTGQQANCNWVQEMEDKAHDYARLQEANKALSESNKELREALDMVTRIFIYSRKGEFGTPEKVKATEKAVHVLLQNGIKTIGETFENSEALNNSKDI